VVVRVIASAISQSAEVMVAPLHDPRGDFGWGIGTIGALMAVYYLVGGLFAPLCGWLGARYGARRLMLAGGLLSLGKPVMAAALLIQGLTVPVLWWAHKAWTFYLFGLGFGGEMSAYLVVNRQYFGAGPTGTLYGRRGQPERDRIALCRSFDSDDQVHLRPPHLYRCGSGPKSWGRSASPGEAAGGCPFAK
jgi:MFS family permease